MEAPSSFAHLCNQSPRSTPHLNPLSSINLHEATSFLKHIKAPHLGHFNPTSIEAEAVLVKRMMASPTNQQRYMDEGLSQLTLPSYGEVGQEAFGRHGRCLVSWAEDTNKDTYTDSISVAKSTPFYPIHQIVVMLVNMFALFRTESSCNVPVRGGAVDWSFSAGLLLDVFPLCEPKRLRGPWHRGWMWLGC